MAREDARLVERRHIARELHANVQQLLYATKIHLSKLRGSESLSQAHDAGESIHELIDETIRVSRDLTRDLIPLSSTGLRSALDSLAEWMKDHHALRVDIEVIGDIESSSLALRELAFECVREVLFNCVKHAHVDEAHVRVDGSGKALRFLVVDEGAGFDVRSETPMEPPRDGSGGFGLSDIRARVERIGGKVDIESCKDSGTKVSLLLPRSVSG
jgi:signal transduction histidine kinase